MASKLSTYLGSRLANVNCYPLVMALLAACVVASGFILIDGIEERTFNARQRAQLAVHAARVKDAVLGVFSFYVGALDALEGLVKTRPNLSHDVFKGVASALVHGHPSIRQIQLSPNAIVMYLHPTHAGDKGHGLDLRSLPGQAEDVEETIRNARTKTVGPLTLQQGGTALITRKPIYIGNGDGRRFWGFATIILDYPKLQKALQAFSDKSAISFALKVADTNGRNGPIIFGDENLLLPDQSLVTEVDIPGAQWILAVAPGDGLASQRPDRLILLVIGLLVSALCGALAYMHATRRIALKSAEREATEKTELLETTFENMAQGFAVYDADLRLVAFNRRMIELRLFNEEVIKTGLHLEEAIRYGVGLDGFSPAETERIVAKRLRDARSGKKFSREMNLPDGTVLMLVRCPMPRGGFVVTYTDITQGKTIQQQLAKESEILATTFNNMDQGISVYDGDLKLVAYNQKFVEIFNLPPSLTSSQPGYEDITRYNAEHGQFGPGDVEDQVRSRVERAKKGKARRFERQTPDGKVHAVWRNPLPDGGFVTTFTDITQRKLMEEDLRRSKEQAESASRAKSGFLANMSHELRTPLNSIIGFSELMIKASFGPLGHEKYAEFAADVNASGHHLLSLINDILDLTKAEAGKFELNEEVIDPAEVVHVCLRLVKEQASSQGIDLFAEVPDQIPPLYCDQRMLKQITLNLLSNAIKFTPEGGKVTLKIWGQPNNGHVLQVIDTGIGVALDNIPKILNPFAQVDSSFNRKHQGTGLGLSLCKNLVELHGGTLDFQSEVGTGSVVTVRFPKERVKTPPVIAKNLRAV